MAVKLSKINLAITMLDSLDDITDNLSELDKGFWIKCNEIFGNYSEQIRGGLNDNWEVLNSDVDTNLESEELVNYIDILGFKRIGKKIANGNYYLDSELNIPVAALNQNENTLDINDFNGKRDIYIMSDGEQVIGYKHCTKDNLVLEPVSNVVYDLNSSSIIYKF